MLLTLGGVELEEVNYDLTLGGAELEQVSSLCILGATFYSKVTLETHLREVVSKVVRSLGAVLRPEKLFDCLRVPKSCFNAYVLSNLEYCAPCKCRLRRLI